MSWYHLQLIKHLIDSDNVPKWYGLLVTVATPLEWATEQKVWIRGCKTSNLTNFVFNSKQYYFR